MSQTRYISLAGNPIWNDPATGLPAEKPLRYTFHRAADIKAMGLGVLASYLGTSIMPMPTVTLENGEAYTPDPASMAVVSLFSNIFMIPVLRWMEKFSLRQQGFNLQDKCIDTCPDGATPPSAADDLRRAHYMRFYFMMMGGVFGGLDCVRIVSSVAANGATSDPLNQIFNGIAAYARAYDGYKRYSKILSGEWRITNMPPPEKITELERKEEAPPMAIPQPSAG